MKEMLLVIDFINDIVHPQGKIARSAAMVEQYNVMSNANNAIEIARQRGMLIAHVKVGFSTGYPECPDHSPIFSGAKKRGALELGTWGTEFHEKMNVAASDYIIIKHRVSALYATSLATLLDAQRVETVMLCGVATNMAIECTAFELHDRGFQVGVLANACGAATLDIHQATLNNLARLATVIEVESW